MIIYIEVAFGRLKSDFSLFLPASFEDMIESTKFFDGRILFLLHLFPYIIIYSFLSTFDKTLCDERYSHISDAIDT